MNKLCCDRLEQLLDLLNDKFKRPALFSKMGMNVYTGEDTRLKLVFEQGNFLTLFKHCPMCGKELT